MQRRVCLVIPPCEIGMGIRIRFRFAGNRSGGRFEIQKRRLSLWPLISKLQLNLL